MTTAEDQARFQAIEAALEARWPETRIAPTLERIAALADMLGSPQLSFPTIHIIPILNKNAKHSIKKPKLVLETHITLLIAGSRRPDHILAWKVINEALMSKIFGHSRVHQLVPNGGFKAKDDLNSTLFTKNHSSPIWL